MNVKLTKLCGTCGLTFRKPYACSINVWLNRRKYCSKSCKNNSQKNKPAWNKGIKSEPNDFTTFGDSVIMVIYSRDGASRKEVLLDRETHTKIQHQRWTVAGKPEYNDYAWSNEYGYLHRYILGLTPDDKRIADHINRNRFDCRLSNLRLTNHFVNARNHTPFKTNTTGINGVQYENDRKKFKATINSGGKQLILGRFETFEAAVTARKAAELKYWNTEAPS